MIDVHCHLEQKDYSEDRDQVIEKCRKELKAVVTSCAHPKDFDLTMQIVERHRGFVFATAGIHPEFVKELKDGEKDNFLDSIKENRNNIVGIGEVGLDYHWVKEPEWQERQKDLFVEMISFSKELKLPLIIHSRDAVEEAVKTLEQEDAKKVLMHMFGDNNLTGRVADNGWSVSLNTLLLENKKQKKIARDIPLQQLMLETDSPWLGMNGRNDPTSVRLVAEKIAEIKKISFKDVDAATTSNSITFFNLGTISNDASEGKM
jgi:TatD DNase family protein